MTNKIKIETKSVKLSARRLAKVPRTALKEFEFDFLVFSDGAATIKDNRYGMAYVTIEQRSADRQVREAFGVKDTTSNRMEIMAILMALRSIKDKSALVRVYSDSMYCINSITNWMWTWEEINAFKLNADLFKLMIDEVLAFEIFPDFKHVRGHNGNQFNELVDGLAVKAKKIGPWSNETTILSRNL